MTNFFAVIVDDDDDDIDLIYIKGAWQEIQKRSERKFIDDVIRITTIKKRPLKF